ncbi:hypothetical protein BDV06DRAFT_225163 [Aspergillus oleicola]
MPVPGGWMVFMLMEMIPGVPLNEFEDYDLAKREKIRQALISSYNYFVDFEDTHLDTSEPTPRWTSIWDEDFFRKSTYRVWGMDDEALVLLKPVAQDFEKSEKPCEVVPDADGFILGAPILVV